MSHPPEGATRQCQCTPSRGAECPGETGRERRPGRCGRQGRCSPSLAVSWVPVTADSEPGLREAGQGPGQRPHRMVGVHGPARRLEAAGPSDSRQGRAVEGKQLALEVEALRTSIRNKQLEAAWRFWFSPGGLTKSHCPQPKGGREQVLQLPGRCANRLLECPASLPGCPFRDEDPVIEPGGASVPGQVTPHPALGAAVATRHLSRPCPSDLVLSSPRGPDHRSDDAGHRRDQGDADPVGRVPRDRADCLPEAGRGAEQDRPPARREETGGDRQDDQEDAEDPGEHQVGLPTRGAGALAAVRGRGCGACARGRGARAEAS